ncbi:MAG TPA: EF-hand domain-containing protein [Opitutaceae bacterium]|nr:EF-hand domain-containing protein [Opitutaceae bacterium]
MKARLFLTLGALLLSVPGARAITLPAVAEIKAAFDAIDTDHNNAISLAEWEKASFALFRAADKNNDNSLDPSELGGTTITQDTFLLIDEDHNGRLSIAEFMRLRRAVFIAADIDRDDSLTFVEFELLTLLGQTGWTDRNHNGRIEPSELKAALVQAFGLLDINHDGFLSAEEAAYMLVDQFKLSDEDHDGKLTQDEFIRGYLKALGAL